MELFKSNMAKEKSAKFLSKSKENCPAKLREKAIIDDGNMCGLIKLGPKELVSLSWTTNDSCEGKIPASVQRWVTAAVQGMYSSAKLWLNFDFQAAKLHCGTQYP